MQKVVGSNPISRFFGNALHVGGLGPAGGSRINWNHPRISPTFRALMRISAWNDLDARGLAPIAAVGLWRPVTGGFTASGSPALSWLEWRKAPQKVGECVSKAGSQPFFARRRPACR